MPSDDTSGSGSEGDSLGASPENNFEFLGFADLGSQNNFEFLGFFGKMGF